MMLDRRAAEAMLLENKAANVTLDSIGESVLRTDMRGNVVFLNRMAEKLTAWCREEALGRPAGEVLRITDGVSGAAVPNAAEIVLKEDKTGKITAKSSNCVLVRRDGCEFGIENTVTPIRDEGGVVTGAVVAFHDVTAARAKSDAVQ
jgi:PAS domain S-box-containing protein